MSFWRDPLRGTKSQEVLVDAGIEGVAQSLVIVVLEGDEAKRLQRAVLGFARGLQDFRHGFNSARCCLDGDFDQIALFQSSGQSQHATSFRDGLQLRPRTAAIIQLDNDRNRALELNSLGAVLRVSLGEVCHSQTNYVMTGERRTDNRGACPDSGLASVLDRF